MKTFIIGLALTLVLSTAMIFKMDNDEFQLTQERYKTIANNAADAASLYYNKEQFSNGIKVFNKTSGNQAAKDVILKGLSLNDERKGGITKYALGKHDYYIYFFDETGVLSKYKNGIFLSSEDIVFPFTFEESLTGYKTQVTEPTVLITIVAGKFDFRESFIHDQELIRTSGYEYVGY